jgi:hypothetical protein
VIEDRRFLRLFFFRRFVFRACLGFCLGGHNTEF